MKIVICSCLFYFGMSFPYLSKSHKPNNHVAQSVGRIVYHFYRQEDTLTPSSIVDEEMVLYFDQSKTVYTSYRKLRNDSAVQRATKEAELRGSTDVQLGVMHFGTSKEEIFSSKTTKNIVIGKLYRQNEYFIEYPKPVINWKIFDITRKISGFVCQKATGNFRGRTYTAWFTTDISYSIGPWKLGGLPGAILEATDEKNQVRFLCVNVTKSGVTLPVAMEVPGDGPRTTEKDFQKMVKAMEEGNGENIDNGSIKISSVRADGAPVNRNYKKPVDNNPIELPVQ